MEGSVGLAVVAGGEDLGAFGVEDGEDVQIGWGGVVGEDVEGGDGDELEFGADGVGEGAGEGGGDAEAGEAAGADGEVEVVEVGGGPALGAGEGFDGGHKFDGVAVVFGEVVGGEEGGAGGKGDGALAAGGVDGEDAGFCGHEKHGNAQNGFAGTRVGDRLARVISNW